MFENVQSAGELFAREAIHPMAGNILFLVRRLNAALEQQGRAGTERFGLSTTQVLVLDHLLRCGRQGVCATDLHRQLGTSKAALSAALKGLCADGYLRAASCPGDDRKKQIIPTPKGRALHRQLEESRSELENLACSGLEAGQIDAAERCLWKMLQNLNRPKAGEQPKSRR